MEFGVVLYKKGGYSIRVLASVVLMQIPCHLGTSSGGCMPKSVWVFSFCLGPLWLNSSHKNSAGLHQDIQCVNRRGWFLTSEPQARKKVLSKMKI